MSQSKNWSPLPLLAVTFGLTGLVCTTMAGCGSAAAANNIPGTAVSGVVTLDGKPASGAMLRFIPTADTRGFGATATADEDGRYVANGLGSDGNLPHGSYKVVVATYSLPEDPDLAKSIPPLKVAPVTIPAAFANEGSTPLTANISDSSGVVDFPLRSR